MTWKAAKTRTGELLLALLLYQLPTRRRDTRSERRAASALVLRENEESQRQKQWHRAFKRGRSRGEDGGYERAEDLRPVRTRGDAVEETLTAAYENLPTKTFSSANAFPSALKAKRALVQNNVDEGEAAKDRDPIVSAARRSRRSRRSA